MRNTVKINQLGWTFSVCCMLCLSALCGLAQVVEDVEEEYDNEEIVSNAEEIVSDAEELPYDDADEVFDNEELPEEVTDPNPAPARPRPSRRIEPAGSDRRRTPRRSLVPTSTRDKNSSKRLRSTPRIAPRPPSRNVTKSIEQRSLEYPVYSPADVEGMDGTADAISFNYKDEDLINVIEAIGRVTGKAFDIDPSIGSTKVTVITHDAIPPELAYEVLESILYVRGFSLKETLDGYLINVVQMAQQTEKQDIFKGRKLPPGYDRFSTHIVTVKYASATDVAPILKMLGSQNGSVDIYETTNTMIISDTADGIKRMFAFLEEVDVPGYDTKMEIITLEYTRAEVLAAQIEEVLMVGAAAVTGKSAQAARRPTPRRTTPRRSTTARTTEPQSYGSKGDVLRIVSDERLNALIVVASESVMKDVLDLVEQLDRPTDIEENNMHIYQLSSAKAKDVESALSSLVGSSSPRKAGAGGGGTAASGEIQPFEKKVSITSYEPTNALLILASPQDYKRLKPIIAQLDVPPRQVHVAATILDVTIDDTWSLAIDMAAATGNDGFALGSTSLIKGLIPGGGVSISAGDLAGLGTATGAASALAAGDYGAALAISLLNLGGGGGITAGIKDTFNVAGVDVPFVPFIINAVETLTKTEVLSDPSLVTRDNEESTIMVGADVPTVGSSRTSASSGAVTSTSIKRQNVGVQMKVKPQISEGDYVALEIDVEVSAVAPEGTGVGDVNLLGPTIMKSQITNKVVIKDGATGVMGGLLSSTGSRRNSQVPLLGDIPFLGKLFQNRGTGSHKQNMIVFVTPHIIKEGVDLARLTDYQIRQFQNTYFDELYDMGVIKKVRKKYERRNNSSDITDRINTVTSGSDFSRGDIER